MKLRSLTLTVVCAVILSVPVLAQNPAQPPAPGEHHRMGKGGPGEGMHGGTMMVDQQMDRLNKELNLTKDQQDKIRTLLTNHHEQMREQMQKATQENRDKIRDLRKQIDAARAAGDKEKVATLETQMRDLMGHSKMEASREKLMTDIAAVLTAEQKPKFEKVKGDIFGWRPSLEEHPELLWRAVESLNLPKEKADKIKGIIDEWKTKSKTAKPEEAKTLKADVYKKVMAELTPEQQAKVKEYHPGPMGAHQRGEGMKEGKGGSGGAGHQHSGGKAPGAAKPKQ